MTPEQKALAAQIRKSANFRDLIRRSRRDALLLNPENKVMTSLTGLYTIWSDAIARDVLSGADAARASREPSE